jgi:hypothetical protein
MNEAATDSERAGEPLPGEAALKDRLATKGIARANRLAFSLVLSLLPTLAHGLDISPESAVHGALHPPVSVDTEAVIVQFGPARYKIPRNYLAGVTQGRDATSYASFTVQVLLPDFVPRTNENSAQFDVVGRHNKFRALFEYGRHPKTPDEILDSYLKNAGMTKDEFRLIGSGYKLYENAKMWSREIYTKETKNGLFFFLCGTKKDGTPFPSCTVNEALGENVGVIYHFSRDYLDEAEDIDLKLHALLQSFKTDGP